ncbi:CMGC/CDK protein kinase [Anncaliia algerae PRA339]|uniref:CMGC/CDK protein kinase n=1 Tax=Anncaliia algerae PRA339 TaxID=1288291 RepID=A0A059EXS0_9MICR|nr:CMGC/CDK protein kinase [Anncaliia algerae PRA339]
MVYLKFFMHLLTKFKYPALNNILRYQNLRFLDEGTYGEVVLMKDIVLRRKVAFKKIKSNYSNYLECKEPSEVRFLKELKHKNIVECVTTINSEENYIIVFEYVEYTLDRYLAKKHDKMGLVQQLLEGVAYIHSKNIMHRDLKPRNILINSKGDLKIADFGHATEFVQGKIYESRVGSSFYKAPELLESEERYTMSVDIWSLGCIIAEIWTEIPLFKTLYPYKFNYLTCNNSLDRNLLQLSIINNNMKYLEFILKEKVINEEIKNLIDSCLKIDSALRPSAASLLEQFNLIRGSQKG